MPSYWQNIFVTHGIEVEINGVLPAYFAMSS